MTAALIGIGITVLLYWAGQAIRREWVGPMLAPGWLCFYVLFPTGVHSGVNSERWVYGLNAIADFLIAYGITTCIQKIQSGADAKTEDGPRVSRS